jgi:hypothetical protein
MLTAPEAIEQLPGAQMWLRNNRRLPAVKQLTECESTGRRQNASSDQTGHRRGAERPARVPTVRSPI